MTEKEQKKAAKEFAQRWQSKGYKKRTVSAIFDRLACKCLWY